MRGHSFSYPRSILLYLSLLVACSPAEAFDLFYSWKPTGVEHSYTVSEDEIIVSFAEDTAPAKVASLI